MLGNPAHVIRQHPESNSEIFPRPSSPLQTREEPRVPPLGLVIANRDAQRFLLPDEHQQSLAPRKAVSVLFPKWTCMTPKLLPFSVKYRSCGRT
jgi:hypothetical protein